MVPWAGNSLVQYRFCTVPYFLDVITQAFDRCR